MLHLSPTDRSIEEKKKKGEGNGVERKGRETAQKHMSVCPSTLCFSPVSFAYQVYENFGGVQFQRIYNSGSPLHLGLSTHKTTSSAPGQSGCEKVQKEREREQKSACAKKKAPYHIRWHRPAKFAHFDNGDKGTE